MKQCFLGRGKLYFQPVPDGGFLEVTGESEISFKTEETSVGIYDARNGQQERVDWFPRDFKAQLEAGVYSLTPEGLAWIQRAATVASASGSFSNYVLPVGVTVGPLFVLPHNNLTSVVVTDSAGSPATVPGSKYTIWPQGLIEFHDVAGYTQPFKVSASYAAENRSVLAEGGIVEGQLLFRGVNIINGRPVMALFHRAKPDPSAIPLVSKSFTTQAITFQILVDFTKQQDAVLGRYGYLRY